MPAPKKKGGPVAKPSIDDLELAATWLRCYEGENGEDDENQQAAQRVAAWLDGLITQRRKNATARTTALRDQGL